jgi:ArsR family transcriptional regulator, arsenate/arsenite/antimonite-responsive transcriptional repressor
MEKDLAAVDRLLKALADPTRLRIIGLLQHGEVCVCDIHDSLRIPQPKASRHLAYLRRAGIVHAEKRGLWVHYRIAPQADATTQTLLDAARHCVAHLKAAERDTKSFERKTGCCATAAPDLGLSCCAVGSRPEHQVQQVRQAVSRERD